MEIPPEGRVVHLKGFGMIQAFKTVSKNGEVEYYATDDTEMDSKECDKPSDGGWGIEEYHRGIETV